MCQSQKEQTVLSNFQGIVFKVMSFINLRYFKIFINIPDLSRRFIQFTDHAMFLFLVLLKEIYFFFFFPPKDGSYPRVLIYLKQCSRPYFSTIRIVLCWC